MILYFKLNPILFEYQQDTMVQYTFRGTTRYSDAPGVNPIRYVEEDPLQFALVREMSEEDICTFVLLGRVYSAMYHTELINDEDSIVIEVSAATKAMLENYLQISHNTLLSHMHAILTYDCKERRDAGLLTLVCPGTTRI